MECWSCSPKGHGSDYLCPRCEAKGARKHKLNDKEMAQLNRSWRSLWSKDAWLAAHPGQKWED